MAQSTPHGGNWVWDGRQWVRLQRPSLGRRVGLFVFTLAGWLLAVAVLLVGVLQIHPHLPGRAAPPVAAADALPAGARPLPSFAPPSSGGIRSVTLTPNGACFVGGKCGVDVTIAFPIVNNPTDFAWTYRIFDPCTGGVTDGPTDRLTAEAGWNRLAYVRTLALPKARSALQVVAVTVVPQPVASSAYVVGTIKCQ